MTNDSYLAGFLIIIVTTILAAAGQLLVRKYADKQKLQECHDVGGQYLAVVGTMYAVLLGLIVVDAMGKFQTASLAVEQEANSLADIFLLAEKMPAPKRVEIQELCLAYVDQVIDYEWPAMDNDQVYLPARKTAVALMKNVMDYEPVKESEKAVYPIIVQEACQLWDNRRMRTNTATRGIPTIEWAVLIIGGIITVVFTYFFYIDYLKMQLAMTALIALIIGLNLFLVLLFGYPFSGDLTVSPEAFKVDQLIFSDKLGMSQTEGIAPKSN